MAHSSSNTSRKNTQGMESSNHPDPRMLLYEEWVRSHPTMVDPSAAATPEAERRQSHMEMQSLIHHGRNADGGSHPRNDMHQINTLLLEQISLHYHVTHRRRLHPEGERSIVSSLSLGNQRSQTMSSSLADAFFQDYPDCCRPPDDNDYSTTSSESNGEINIEDASDPMLDCVYIETVPPKENSMAKQPPHIPSDPSKEPMPPPRISPTSTILTAEAPPHPRRQEPSHPNLASLNPYSNPTYSNQPSQHTSYGQSRGPAMNPYASGNGIPRPKSRESSTVAASSWENVAAHNSFPTAREVGMLPSREPASNPHASWDDVQAQNPFQTAREVARLPPPDPNFHLHPPQPPPNSHGNPYHKPEPPPPPVPIIRESLKRKFQPPIRRDPSTATNGAQSSTSTLTRPRSSTATQAPSTKEDDPTNDLPEELQMYGAELVAKIENEIMDQTDPITFDDIAGLHEQKQTVYEIVCWPMKRPDLFTGLRAAPNGLLLYGPPGTGMVMSFLVRE
jgi:hypothetical protein